MGVTPDCQNAAPWLGCQDLVAQALLHTETKRPTAEIGLDHAWRDDAYADAEQFEFVVQRFRQAFVSELGAVIECTEPSRPKSRRLVQIIRRRIGGRSLAPYPA